MNFNQMPASKARPFTIIVEGNIGSGKTTFLQHFANDNNTCVLSEPVSMWQDCSGNNLLGLMYEDPKRWAFTFQSYVQLTMLQQHTKPTNSLIKLMERSIFSARYCFVENMLREKSMSAPGAAVINEWFNWVISHAKIDVDLIIYLRTSPEVVYRRMMERNRTEEQSVPLDYLTKLHELHEDWLYHKKSFPLPAPVIVLNADLDKTLVTEEFKKYEPCIRNEYPVKA